MLCYSNALKAISKPIDKGGENFLQTRSTYNAAQRLVLISNNPESENQQN
jgi:hypothetical protein